ncbi:hypothetical protein RSP673_010495 [Ralstonia solanacearum P673]|uniref:hypothetical protein n=1 Tax=Ralstonia solanacearum TaxID=305 RepID=UPI0009B8596E|nr:hypothetical protein [Ralstonia solanacearum]MCL9849240.1 hypothetical protein [Ralstonia solanacearum]MCL9854828.1 hypothetical protein [Ralstonia solanacearum]MCL9861822.1 hypothetical protein [Ralstonia solanacearum]MCL9864488.1 hypothetical protein [Ralstonia solanacearum]MCL9868886.1 hypothetical protein [Ralstonia solanacearum]
MSISVRVESQLNPVADEVSALIAVVRPILQGLVHALKVEVVAQVGGVEQVPLFMLPRLYRAGDGDCGICFEYAVHDAIQRGEASVLERVTDSMRRHCRVPGNETASILFGAEKTGSVQLIATAGDVLTDDSRLLTGAQAQPPKLKQYLNLLAAAFRRPTTRVALPWSISGLWKADLFLGNTDSDRWVGTTVKINPNQLEAARGLRIGIVPAFQGRDDRVRFDAAKNLVVCPLPYDGAFMELFYHAWGIVQQFLAADAKVPREVALPTPAHRMVAQILEDRRQFPVLDVVEALGPLAQPELLRTDERDRTRDLTRDAEPIVDTLIAPVSRVL